MVTKKKPRHWSLTRLGYQVDDMLTPKGMALVATEPPKPSP